MAQYEIFETERYIPCYDNTGKPTGYSRYVGQRLLEEARVHIEKALKGIITEWEGESMTLWSTLDYFHAHGTDPHASKAVQEFPRCAWVAVFAVEGANEGIYIHVEAIGPINASGISADDKRVLLFLGKTYLGFDTAMEIVKAITREFHR